MKTQIDTTDVRVWMSKDRSKVLTSHFVMAWDSYILRAIPVKDVRLIDPTGYTFYNFERILDVNRILEDNRYTKVKKNSKMPTAPLDESEEFLLKAAEELKLSDFEAVPVTMILGE